MLFTGQQARSIELTVETILIAFLGAKLSSDALPYKFELASFGGADVVLADQEETRAEQIGRPTIVLNKTGHAREFETWPDEGGGPDLKGFRNEFTYEAEVLSTEFTGSLVGVTNPTPAEEILSGILTDIMDTGFDELADLGLEEAENIPPNELQEVDELVRVNTHKITFVAHTLMGAS